MTRLYCDGPTLMRAVAAAVANLEAHVDEVDSLNVFPVPDGDTGSNMLATMRAALAEAEQLSPDECDLHHVAEALSRGALTGARGNSGVILSQIIRGMTDGADGRRRATGLDLAEGLKRGSEVAYGSVLTPVEGTMLTVIRDAAEAAEAAAGRQPHVEAVLAETIEAALVSVRRTPTLLPILQDAGVVDSGGQGLYRLLEGTMQLQMRPWTSTDGVASASLAEPSADSRPAGRDTAATATMTFPDGAGHDHDDHGHGYETEYLLVALARALDMAAIRSGLEAVGDSVIVAGDERLARIHVHGQRPDLALAIGLSWGRLQGVSIRDLDEQVAELQLAGAAATVDEAAEAPPVSLVAAAAAEGIAVTLESLGAHVVRPAHGTRPSVGEIAAGILASGSPEVVVLPNDADAILAAGQAAALTPLVAITVIETRNAAEVIAAALAFDRSSSAAENAPRMTAEARSVRSFIVTTAARDSVVGGERVVQGQVIAVDPDGRLLARAVNAETATLQALATLVGFDLVTCYYGAALSATDAEELRERIEQQGWGAEVELIAGGQRHDHLLVAVE